MALNAIAVLASIAVFDVLAVVALVRSRNEPIESGKRYLHTHENRNS